MVTMVIGILEKFEPEMEIISSYLERVENYFAANNIQEDLNVPVFLNAIGSLLRNTLAPWKLSEQNLPTLKTALKEHYEPQKVVIAERFHFYKWHQAAGESKVDYVAKLRKLATHCDFKDNLDDALRNKFICGLSKETNQRKLLSEKKLTFSKAIALAKNIEAVEEESKKFHEGGEPIHHSVQKHSVTSVIF